MKIGTTELLVILAVVLLIFGPKNLPKLGKMFGKTIGGFKKGMEDVDENGDPVEEDDEDEEPAPKKTSKKSTKKAAKKIEETEEEEDTADSSEE